MKLTDVAFIFDAPELRANILKHFLKETISDNFS